MCGSTRRSNRCLLSPARKAPVPQNGNPFRLVIEQLKTQGVQFDVCEITLERRKLSKSTFVPEATYVPSGVAEITRLQQREGYAYLRP
jgi:intracellular sulfur oxidation DsrE/DsrF family protein